MKKLLSFILMCIVVLSSYAQRCAVLEFKAGSGISQADVDGISAIFITYFQPEGYTMVERTQINKTIEEQGFQRSLLTENQMVRIGQILNVSKIVVGDVNVVLGEYNIDARVINVETGTLSATDGISVPKGGSYRNSMQKLAENLASKIAIQSGPIVPAQQNNIQQASQSVQNSTSPTILYGYLKVFPYDLGTFDSAPNTVIGRLNESEQYGYNTWRVPTREEIQLLAANGLIGSSESYMTSDGNRSGVLRLVTDQKTASEVNKERREKEELERQEKAENERVQAEQQRLEDAFNNSLSAWEKAYLSGLMMGYELDYVVLKESYSSYGEEYRHRIWSYAKSTHDGWECGYNFYKNLANDQNIDNFLKKYDYWWCCDTHEYYDDPGLPTVRGSRLDHYSGTYVLEVVYGSAKHEYDYWYVLMFNKAYAQNNFNDPPKSGWGVYREDTSYPVMFGRKISSSEATEKYNSFCSKRLEEIGASNVNSQIGEQNASTSQNIEAVDLGLSVKWASCNIGATKPEEFGNYYAWGETVTKYTYNWSTYKHCNISDVTFTKYCNTDNKTILDAVDDVARQKWVGNWRIPTEDEFQELINNCTWVWIVQNGICGYKVTSNKFGYTDNSIFLPAAGGKQDTDTNYSNSIGYYWSSKVNKEDISSGAWGILFNSYEFGIHSNARCLGLSVRPVCPKDISVSRSYQESGLGYSAVESGGF